MRKREVRVLWVDRLVAGDERDLGITKRQMQQRCGLDGLEFEIATSNADMINRLRTEPYDMVCYHITMDNDKEGYPCLKEIKQIKPGILLVAMTGMTYEERIKTKFPEGVFDYIQNYVQLMWSRHPGILDILKESGLISNQDADHQRTRKN